MAATYSHKHIASRYVTALFELAESDKSLDKTQDELEALGQLYTQSPAFARLCNDPTLSVADQQAGLEGIAKKLKLSALTLKFLKTLTVNRRLVALPAVISGFADRLRAHHGEVVAQVKSASKLKKADETKLIALLSAHTGKKVVLNVTQDESLLGGLRILVDGTMIDATVEGRLNQLKEKLYHGIRHIA